MEPNQVVKSSLSDLTLDELTENLSRPPQPPRAHWELAYQTEFIRRQTEAAIETARFTRDNARYMLWSVAVLAFSSTGTLAVAILAWRFPK